MKYFACKITRGENVAYIKTTGRNKASVIDAMIAFNLCSNDDEVEVKQVPIKLRSMSVEHLFNLLA